MMNKSEQNAFVTVLTPAHPAEAMVIQTRLKSEGIQCLLKNECLSNVLPYLFVTGGMELQVHPDDYPRAMKILETAGYLQ
jgi:hypothetical protein